NELPDRAAASRTGQALLRRREVRKRTRDQARRQVARHLPACACVSAGRRCVWDVASTAAAAPVTGVPAERVKSGIEYRVGLQNIGSYSAEDVVVELRAGTATVGRSEPIPVVAGTKAYANLMTPETFTGPYRSSSIGKN